MIPHRKRLSSIKQVKLFYPNAFDYPLAIFPSISILPTKRAAFIDKHVLLKLMHNLKNSINRQLLTIALYEGN